VTQARKPLPELKDREAFRLGIVEFNSGRFFEAHEAWEEIWLHSPEPEKTFLQGIIQIAAAFHHHSKGNLRGTRSLLEAGLGRTEHFPDAHRGIDLAALRCEAMRWAAALAAGRIPASEIPPRIEFR
jgi:predicted metal-dependent hydrolase